MAIVAIIQAASIAYLQRTENLPRAEKNFLNLTVSYSWGRSEFDLGV